MNGTSKRQRAFSWSSKYFLLPSPWVGGQNLGVVANGTDSSNTPLPISSDHRTGFNLVHEGIPELPRTRSSNRTSTVTEKSSFRTPKFMHRPSTSGGRLQRINTHVQQPILESVSELGEYQLPPETSKEYGSLKSKYFVRPSTSSGRLEAFLGHAFVESEPKSPSVPAYHVNALGGPETHQGRRSWIKSLRRSSLLSGWGSPRADSFSTSEYVPDQVSPSPNESGSPQKKSPRISMHALRRSSTISGRNTADAATNIPSCTMSPSTADSVKSVPESAQIRTFPGHFSQSSSFDGNSSLLPSGSATRILEPQLGHLDEGDMIHANSIQSSSVPVEASDSGSLAPLPLPTVLAEGEMQQVQTSLITIDHSQERETILDCGVEPNVFSEGNPSCGSKRSVTFYEPILEEPSLKSKACAVKNSHNSNKGRWGRMPRSKNRPSSSGGRLQRTLTVDDRDSTSIVQQQFRELLSISQTLDANRENVSASSISASFSSTTREGVTANEALKYTPRPSSSDGRLQEITTIPPRDHAPIKAYRLSTPASPTARIIQPRQAASAEGTPPHFSSFHSFSELSNSNRLPSLLTLASQPQELNLSTHPPDQVTSPQTPNSLSPSFNPPEITSRTSSGSFSKSFTSMMGGLSSLGLSRTSTREQLSSPNPSLNPALEKDKDSRGRSINKLARVRSASHVPPDDDQRSRSRTRSVSPFPFRRFRNRDVSPLPQAIPLTHSDVDLSDCAPSVHPRLTAFADDSGDEGIGEETEDEDWSNDEFFDSITEWNTEQNAIISQIPVDAVDGVIADPDVDVDPDPLGEGVNVVVPPEPYFPSTLNGSGLGRGRRNPRRRKSTKTHELIQFQTSRPAFQRDRCTITVTQGDPDASRRYRKKRKYLVGSDLSNESRFAMEWAIGTVLRDGDELLLVTVIEADAKVDPVGQGPIDRTAKLRSQQERQGFTYILVRQATSLLQRTKLNVTITCQAWHAKNARHMLLDIVDHNDPTMVIVGSRGLGRLKGILLGSTSHYLIQKSSVPVMVARRRLKRPPKRSAHLSTHRTHVSLAEAGIDRVVHKVDEDVKVMREEIAKDNNRKPGKGLDRRDDGPVPVHDLEEDDAEDADLDEVDDEHKAVSST